MTVLSSFFFPKHKSGLNQQNLSLVEINYFLTPPCPFNKIKPHFYLIKVSKCICVAYHELREPCIFKTMVSTKSAFLRTCNMTYVWGDIINWSSKIDLFRVLYRIKSTTLRIWQSNQRKQKPRALELHLLFYRVLLGCTKAVAQETHSCCRSMFPGPATSKAEHIFPTCTYRTTHIMQLIYGYMQIYMPSHTDPQRQKHTNATTINGFIVFPAPGKKICIHRYGFLQCPSTMWISYIPEVGDLGDPVTVLPQTHDIPLLVSGMWTPKAHSSTPDTGPQTALHTYQPHHTHTLWIPYTPTLC